MLVEFRPGVWYDGTTIKKERSADVCVRHSVGVVRTMLMLHMNTVVLLCRYFGEDMRKRGKGYILNMSSMSAWFSYPDISLYASTKCFLKMR